MLLRLDEFCMAYADRPHMQKFREAYERGMERDPINFDSHHTVNEWIAEYDLFIDVGGDAEDPINDEAV